MRNGNFTWEGLGAPEGLIPSPPPLLPIPRAVVRFMEGLKPWKAYVLREPNVIEDIGLVWGTSKAEAEEAAENLVGGPGVMAVGVMKE